MHHLAFGDQRRFPMPEWLTQLLAFVALSGLIGFVFWKARGVKPRKGNTDNFQIFDGHWHL
jgi:hypothetical protein